DRSDADPREAAAASKHAEVCANCAALLESWRGGQGDLRLLRGSTGLQSAPSRVEMRRKKEVRPARGSGGPRRTVAVASLALVAAAVLAVSAGWIRRHLEGNAAKSGAEATTVGQKADSKPILLAADYDDGEFTQLPGNLPGASDESSVLQVRVQR